MIFVIIIVQGLEATFPFPMKAPINQGLQAFLETSAERAHYFKMHVFFLQALELDWVAAGGGGWRLIITAVHLHTVSAANWNPNR